MIPKKCPRKAESEIEDLRRFSKFKGLLTPDYNGRCISNLCDTFSKILGIPYSRPLKHNSVYEIAESTESLVFLLLDGFGYKPMQHALNQAEGAPALSSFIKNGGDGTVFHPLTSVFPSTTSTATTTLHTGLTPQEHGVLGYTMYLQEIGAIAEMLRFSPIVGGRSSIFDLGFDPETFVNSDTIHQKLTRSGITSSIYINKYIVDSGLSKITNRGAQIHPHMTAADMFVSLRKNLESRHGANSFHFAYFASPDTIAHHKGPYSEEFASEVDSLFYILRRELLEKLDKKVAKKTTIIVSADHGLINIDESNVIDVRDHPELKRMLKVPPTGDSRVSFLHTKDGMQENVLDYFNKNFPGKFEVARSQVFLEKGLFGVGKVKQEVIDRIGSLVAVPKVPVAIENSDIDSRPFPVPGRHGGLSEDEMLVPLIARKLAS